ncbi:MAG: cold shock domain-containing protein [Bacteroidia bacterium]|nr:cold shock domain-containing protein [Bacteroidia bacterium]
MGDSFNKKEREKKKQKKRKEKEERRKEKNESEGKSTDEFMYLDDDGNLTSTPPDPNRKRKESKIEDIVISTPKSDDSDEPTGPRSGVVKFFNEEKGYGFIIESETDNSYFVHVNDLIDRINDNDKVTFEVGHGPKGEVAKEVSLQK